jgi:chorismate mutase
VGCIARRAGEVQPRGSPVTSLAVSHHVRAVRGATTLDADTIEQLEQRVPEVVQAMLDANHLRIDDVISIIFTATPDVTSGFPASAARRLPLHDTPLLGAMEVPVRGALELCIRVLMHVDSSRDKAEIHHVFLHGAGSLRPDLARD